MKLYFSPGTCALVPHILLREAGLSFELEKVSLNTKKTARDVDFFTINPKGYVPVLELDGGERLTEVIAITQYIADLAPAAGLLPVSGIARYHTIGWTGFMSTELHKQFTPVFNPKVEDTHKERQRELIASKLDYVARSLGDKPYLMGDGFTVPDAYLYTVFRWTKLVSIDPSKWPSIQAHAERVAARPAVHAALEAEGLLKAKKV